MTIRKAMEIKEIMKKNGFIAETVEEVIPGKKYMVCGDIKAIGILEQFDSDVFIEGSEITIFTQYGITKTAI